MSWEWRPSRSSVVVGLTRQRSSHLAGRFIVMLGRLCPTWTSAGSVNSVLVPERTRLILRNQVESNFLHILRSKAFDSYHRYLLLLELSNLVLRSHMHAIWLWDEPGCKTWLGAASGRCLPRPSDSLSRGPLFLFTTFFNHRSLSTLE
jgi:hypothetical protein